MRLTIITPTLLRPSLAQTCHSINQQSFEDWEHLCMIDVLLGDGPEAALGDIRRNFIRCQRPHGNFGNTCRNQAFDHATGDYVQFLDDDDVLAAGALQIIAYAAEEKRPNWILFPALVRGERWLKLPPGKGMTVSCQFAYRRDLGIRWPDSPDYSADGDLVEELMKVSQPFVLDCEYPLVIVERSNYGAVGG